jgi:hypothetical protein
MALMDFNQGKSTTGVQLANRNDSCYLCAREIKAKDERDFNKQIAELKGKEEGKPVLKVGRTQGSEICICMNCIRKIAKEHPAQKE